jgi:hypothetical protein
MFFRSDDSNILRKEGKEVLVSGIRRGRGCAMGTMVRSLIILVVTAQLMCMAGL